MPTNSPLSENEKLALHEAGHAMMFGALGVPIEFVTIDAGCGGEEPSYEGCVKLGRDSNNVCDVIAGTLAGPAASFFIAYEAIDSKAMVKFKSDQTKMHEIYRNEKNPGTWDDFWIILQTFQGTWLRTWLENHRAAIERFAHSLIAKRTLSGEELAQSLETAWDGSKPDATALKNEVASVIDTLINGNQNCRPQDIESSGGNGMQVFRLVNEKHDSIEVGSLLTRTSDHSNQKIAEGIYFALTYEDALAFSKKDHGHAYTYLLTCRLQGISAAELVDLIVDENLILRFKASAKPPISNLTGRALNTKYCEIHEKKGILWKAREGWKELCILRNFAKGSVIIEAAETLP